jgi:hypothetical protein
MNRRRSARNLSFGSVVFLVFVAVVLATAGVFHAYVKNLQVQVGRKTEKTEKRIGQLEMDILTLQMRLDEQLIRPLLRKRLSVQQSPLVPIPLHVIVEIDQQTPNRNPEPDLAHRGP